MKITTHKQEPEPQFKPFELKIVAEIEEELRAIYAIFNLVRNVTLIGDKEAINIRDKIRNSYPDFKTEVDDIIAKGVRRTNYYK